MQKQSSRMGLGTASMAVGSAASVSGAAAFGSDLKQSRPSRESDFVDLATEGKAPRMIRGRRTKGQQAALPPRLMVTLGGRKTLRFSSGGNASVTVADLLGALGVIGTVTNTTAVAICSSVKVHAATVWNGASSSATSTIGLDWAAGESSQVPDEMHDESIPAGVTETSSLVFRPPKGSLASFWITSADSAAVVFAIKAPAGSVGGVLDLDVSFRICDTIQPLAISVVTAVLGHVYYLALDGPSGNSWVPTTLPSTH